MKINQLQEVAKLFELMHTDMHELFTRVPLKDIYDGLDSWLELYNKSKAN